MRHQDALLLLSAAVDAGRATLPLSYVHYVETARRRPFAKREPLARPMADLSRFSTIAPYSTVVRAEIRCAIAEWFESRVVPDPPTVFGRGADHAFDSSLLANGVAGLVASYGSRALGARMVLEWGALAGHPDDDSATSQRGTGLHDAFQAEADRLEQLRDIRRPEGWTRGSKAKRVWTTQAFVDTLDVMNAAFEEADVPAGRLMAGGADAMTAFLRRLPALHARYELGRLKEQATCAAWTPNDIRDLEAISVALAHADVVVTEKSWADFSRRANLTKTWGPSCSLTWRSLSPSFCDSVPEVLVELLADIATFDREKERAAL
jgi:hypothetical protein